MTQMTDIIKIISRLQTSKYVSGRDDKEILGLYKAILEIVNDKNGYIEHSASLLNALTENILTDEVKQQWLGYASSIFASYMAVKIFEDESKGQCSLTIKETDQVLDFYLYGDFLPEVRSLGIYSCARQLSVESPMRSYELTKTAFSMNPDLAGILGIAYRYEGQAAEENLTEECPFCGSSGKDIIPYYCSPQVMKLENRQSFPPAKLWMKCEACGNYFTYNFPKDNVGSINGHYTNGTGCNLLQNKFNLYNYSPIFNQFKSLTPGTEYLEIGIGTGEMLAVALEFGYHVEAVEICREDCERISQALGVGIKWCDIIDYETEKQFDVIVMGDVLEHVLQPVKVLEKVKQMLSEDGVLWISTPNYNCAYARMEKFSHCMWHELNHYTYMSYETLEELLESMQMDIVHYDISSRYIGSMELFIKHAE